MRRLLRVDYWRLIDNSDSLSRFVESPQAAESGRDDDLRYHEPEATSEDRDGGGGNLRRLAGRSRERHAGALPGGWIVEVAGHLDGRPERKVAQHRLVGRMHHEVTRDELSKVVDWSVWRQQPVPVGDASATCLPEDY